MLNAYSERMTSCGLRLEKTANLEEVLSIKLSLKHSLLIFAIVHSQSPYMVDVLLVVSKDQMWLLACWRFQSPDEAPSRLPLIKD